MGKILKQYVERLDPKIAGFVFGTCSAITMAFSLILLRIIVGSAVSRMNDFTGAQEIGVNLALGSTLTFSLAVLVPGMFCSGWIAGFIFASVFNIFAPSNRIISLPPEAIKLKED